MVSVPRYWRELPERSRFVGIRCAKCGTVSYPPRSKCLKCGSESLIAYKLPERGRIVTFTIVRSPPKGFEKMVPYVLGVVELEDGTNVTVQITDVEPDEVRIGMPVEAVFRKICEDGDAGIIEYALKFRPSI